MAQDTGVQDSVFSLAVATGGRAERWFAARASGLYVSDDGGRSWRDAYGSLGLAAPLTTAAVALSPQYNRDRTVFVGVMGGVLRSTDGGDTWTTAILPEPPPYVVALTASPCYEEDGLVFAATMEDGVYRSWDRGANWASWNFGLLDLSVFSLAISPSFQADETLFAGTESGIFRSTNGGRAWRELPFPMEYAPVLALALSPAFETDRTMVVGTEAHGIFFSTDGGATWNPALDFETSRAVNQLVYVFSRPDRRTIVALVGADVFCSHNGGRDWAKMPISGAESAGPTCFCAVESPDGRGRLLVGFDDGRVLVGEIPQQVV